MAGRTEELQRAGFSEEEIGAWAGERRSTLSQAGFADNEIDSYFTGGVTAPTSIPTAFVDRMSRAMEFSKSIASSVLPEGYTDIPRESWQSTADTLRGVVDHIVPKTLGGGRDPGKEGVIEGQLKTGAALLDIVSLPFMPIVGAVRSLVGHPMVLADEAIRDGAVSLYGEEAVARAEKERGAKAGPLSYEDAKGVVDTALLAIGSRPVKRIGMSATGQPEIVEVGGLPTSTDFVNAAKVTAADGTAPMAVQEKMLAAYEQQGRHPAEIAHDAQNDPVVAQRLLSKDELDLPYDYSPWRFNEHDTPALSDGLEAHRKEMGGSRTEDFHPDITSKKVETVHRIDTRAGEIPDLPELFDHFEIKPLEAPKEQPLPREGSLESAQKEILDKISVNGRDPERKFSLAHLYKEAIDDLHPLKAASEEAYQMARLTRGQFGKAEYFLERGTFDFNTYKDTGKSLREIVAPVRSDLDGLRTFISARRAMELEEGGRTSGMDFLAARQVVSEGKGTYAKIADDLVAYQNRTLEYLRDSGVIAPDAFDAMVEANKAYVPFFRLFAAEKNAKGTGSSFGPANPIKALKGSERDIIDPLESIIKNTYAYVAIAERNAVGVELIDALKGQGYKVEKPRAKGATDGELVSYLKEHGVTEPEKLVDFVKAATEDADVIGAIRDGVREQVKVNDPDLVAAFRGIDRQSAGLLTRIFSIPAKTLRAGAVLTPDFMARNLVRDFMTAFVNSKGVFHPVDSLTGLVSVLRKDAAWEGWVKSGGANATMVALDRAYLQESLTKLSADTGLMERSWNVVKSPLTGLRLVSELIENATRVAEFKKAGGLAGQKEVMQSAAYASREVTLDFARMGAKMRSYNMLTAFANAQIQGVDRIGRAFIDRPVNTSLKVAGGITLPSILLWWANKDDQRVKELPHWQKDLFWVIPTDKWESISPSDATLKPSHLVRERDGKWEFNNGSIYRIPKPFELGVVFGSGPERVLDHIYGENPDAFDGFTKSVIEAFTPNFIPTAVQPAIEQFANRSTFSDRTLIPADMEKHLPEYQYTPYTTQLARKIGRVVAAFPGMTDASVDQGNKAGPVARALSSPILIENYVRSWTGGMGMYVLNAADLALRTAGALPDPEKPAATLADIPFVKAFVVRYPSASAQPIQDFYDEHAKTKTFFDTWMARAKEGDAEAMGRIQEAGGPGMFARLDEIKTVLSEHSKLVRDVYKNPNMKGDEKRQIIDGLYYAMIQIAQAGRDMQRQVAKPQ